MRAPRLSILFGLAKLSIVEQSSKSGSFGLFLKQTIELNDIHVSGVLVFMKDIHGYLKNK